jgi:serine/threonine protein kinase
MEYAEDGSLRSYLEKNFSKLTWNDKFNMAYQLAYAVSCLHNEGIIHRDLVIYSLLFVYCRYIILYLSLLI